MVWCTTTLAEQYKCLNFTRALERDRALFEEHYINVSCHQAFTTDECIQLIDAEKAHMMTLDAGEVFIAGRYNSLIPIMQESFEGGFVNYYAVAVVKKGELPDVTSIRHLRGKKACFSEVGSQAGWTIPVHTVINSPFDKMIFIFLIKIDSDFRSCNKRVEWKLSTATIM